MTKTEIWAFVQEAIITNEGLFKKGKSEELLKVLSVELQPKSGGGTTHPSYVDDETNETMYYCRFHQRHEPETDMVMSKDKSKGYCKASISKWNKTNSTIKKLNEKSVQCLEEDNFEEAKSIAQEVKDLRANLNNPNYYNYEEDWSNFNS